MSQQIINVGSVANDTSADTARAAFQKAVANFTELYALTTSFSIPSAGQVAIGTVPGGSSAVLQVGGALAVYGIATIMGSATVQSPGPLAFQINDTGAATDEKRVHLYHTGTGFQVLFANDAVSSATAVIDIARAGLTATSITLRATSVTVTGTLTLAATAAAGDNSLKAATTAYADRPFTSTTPGAVPASGGGTTTFLRADGSFAAPPGGGGSSSIPVTTVAASGTTQTISFPASGSAAYDVTLTGNCVFTLTGGTAGQHQTVILYLRQDATAGRVPTLPTGVKWPGGTAPVPNTAAGAIDVFRFTTPDAGATVFGDY